MIKYLLEKVIRLRNPQFQFDPAVRSALLSGILFENLVGLFRGFRVCLRLRNPRLMVRGRSVRFFHYSHIEWGTMVKINDYAVLNATGKGKIRLGNNVSVGAFSRLIISTSLNNLGTCIHIGNNVGIGEFAYLGGGGGLSIGDDCIIGQYFSCHPENHYYLSTDILIRQQGVSRCGIKIGNNCWIGAKVTICDGIEIGNHCIIAAGAVVTRNLPDYSVAGGVPAQVIKTYVHSPSTTPA